MDYFRAKITSIPSWTIYKGRIIEDLSNRRFNKLTIIRYSHTNKQLRYWLCLCDCGNYTTVPTSRLKNNNTKSCGCLQKERLTERNRSNESLIGQKFGRLTVLALDTAKKRRSWISQCECGNIVSISTRHLKIGNTKSCGCFKKEYDSEPIHGYSHHPLYVKWSSIKARCTNKENISYKNYGGRGIKLCSEWFNNPEKFIEYVIVLENYGLKGYSLDRINNDGDYEPRNVRWATREQQRQNSRNLVFNPELIKKIRHHYNTKGGTYKELSELFNTNVNNIYDILTNKTWKNIV